MDRFSTPFIWKVGVRPGAANIGQQVYTVSVVGDGEVDSVINVVDPRTGHVDRTVTVPYPVTHLVSLGSDKLLAFSDDSPYDETGVEIFHMRVLDRQSFSELSNLAGEFDYSYLGVDEDGKVVTLSSQADRVDVFDLVEDDSLVLNHSFQVARPYNGGIWFHRSHVYVQSPQPCVINVYNVNTGCG